MKALSLENRIRIWSAALVAAALVLAGGGGAALLQQIIQIANYLATLPEEGEDEEEHESGD